ncbi:MAG TPA: AmmeMemoRadiSam system protein B [Polyangia bacterium]|nr:AmmeMemoRadiSam system protein B [Polyangia bacterium]
MAAPLPRLRHDLDIMPSPLDGQPGLLIRDPMRYSTFTLVVPPALIPGLVCFDGRQDEADLRATLARATGRVTVAEAARGMVAALSDAGFLDDARFAALRDTRAAELGALAERPAAHAGSAYPDRPSPLTRTLRGYFDGAQPGPGDGGDAPGQPPPFAIAAPHVSPEGGWKSYVQAYQRLPPAAGDRVFVILATSHYGAPDRYGLTRKPFATPFGRAVTDTALVDALAAAAPGAVSFDEPAAFVEHAAEFQVVFLQHLYGPDVRIVPVLCGAFAGGPRARRRPETNPRVAQFIGALGELAARDPRLTFVLGVDFAHVGLRYGDGAAARADVGDAVDVARRDRERMARIAAGDADGFWDLVTERGDDDLKWCGTSPLYTFLRAVPGVRGRVHGYEQWNIDPSSIVSFGALSFSRN